MGYFEAEYSGNRMNRQNGYAPLLRDSRFEAFLCTQFLGAFNDSVYKIIVSIFALRAAADSAPWGGYLAVAGAVFVIPFLVFAGYAGQVADRFSKTRVLQITKSLEVITMMTGIAALVSGRMDFLLTVLFLLAVQATFFSPARYGILPEIMPEANLSRANGLLELTTFVAIVTGASFGTFLYGRWQDEPVRMGAMMLGIAIIGTLASLHIRKVPPASMPDAERFHWNPFREIIEGGRELRERRALAMSVLGISWFWFTGALFQLALLLEGKEVLHVSDGRAGFLVTPLALGIGFGSVAAGAISGEHIELGLVPAGSALMGVSAILLGLTASYAWALVWLAAVGFCAGLFAVPLNAYLQQHAGATEKGRILATNNFANMVGVVAASGVLWLLHHWLHQKAGVIILELGIATLIGAAGVARMMPAISVRFVLWCISKLLFRVEMAGAEHVPRTGPGLLVSNHISYADAVLVGLTTPRIVRFLMWQPIYEIPVARNIFDVLLAIPVDNGSPKSAMRALHAAREALMQGSLAAIFPEGQVSRNGELRPFERGFERIVRGTGAPIIPIHIGGMYGHPLSCKGGGLLKSWERAWRPRVMVRVGEPIYREISSAELRRIVEELADGRATAAVHA